MEKWILGGELTPDGAGESGLLTPDRAGESGRLTPEEKARRVEEFFAKKRAQNAGEEAAPTQVTVNGNTIEMGNDTWAGVKGAVEGWQTGWQKGARRAAKAGLGALVVDPLIGVAKLAGTPVRLLGWDGIHRLADAAEKSFQNWGADALDYGCEDWGTQLGDVGAKITGLAGMAASFLVPGMAAAKGGKMLSTAAKAYNAALPYIFGNRAAVDAYDTAKGNGQGTARALTEAAANGAIHFIGFKAFQNRTLENWLKIPELHENMMPKFLQKAAKEGIQGFSGLVKAVRDGQLRDALVRRGVGAFKAGGILGAQNFFSSIAEQYANELMKPANEMSDDELRAAMAQINAWEAEQAAAAAEGRSPNTDLMPEWEKDLGDRLAVALKQGGKGFGEGVFMEGVMGAGEAGLTLWEARAVTEGAIRAMTKTARGRAFLNAQNPDALGVVAGVAREGGTPTKEQLDAAGLPPDMEMRDVRRLAFDLKRDVEMADERAARATEEYRKRQELAERWMAEHKDGEVPDFKNDEQGKADEKGAELELALKEREERIAEKNADAITGATQDLADRLFGKDAGILVRRGTAEEARRAAEGAVGKDADARTLKDAEGNICGYWDRGTGELVIFRGADVSTVAHELGWHATRNWAERNAPELLKKMNEYAKSAPPELIKQIEELYPDFARNPDALLDEIGAARFERELGKRFTEILERSPEAKSWWQGLKELIAEAWRGMIRGSSSRGIDWKRLEGMEPEKGMEWLVEQMAEGKRIGGGEKGGFDFVSRRDAEAQSGKVRPQISGIFTGSAADYAHKNEKGEIEDGPSLKKIGSGEGTQVYGHGLYGSTLRNDAEYYAAKAQGNFVPGRGGDGRQRIYEQTFFTNRAPGDESHLLSWYDEVSPENRKRIDDALIEVSGNPMDWTGVKTGEDVYRKLAEFASPEEASEFLARNADIDGIKYPAEDHHGRMIGDAEGWNYVSFRDDNIRVDHKWTDGQMRYQRKLKNAEKPEGKTVGEKIEGLVKGSLKRTDGAIQYRESETDARRLATEARKVYDKYANKEYKLPTGGVLYFQPDARTVEAYGGDEAAAWGEYALHLITHSRGSGEARYRSFDGRSIDIVLPNIEEIIKADKVKAQDGRIIFFKQTKKAESKTKSRYAYLVTEPDAEGNLRVDLRYITGMQDRGFLPGDTATLKEVISDRTAEGHALHRNQDGADYTTGGEAAQGGEIRPQRKATKEETDRIIEHFGTTRNINEAGYILPDGRMLDLSGRKDGASGGRRTLDHRKVWDVLDDRADGGEAMADFVWGGAIRIQPEANGIMFGAKPTEAQESAVLNYFRHFNGEMQVDIMAPNGDFIASASYAEGTRPQRILNEIKRYYDEGVEPTGTGEQADGTFRYQRKLKPEEKAEVTADERKATRMGAEKALKALARKPLKNLQTGIEAQINAVQRNKILSNAATNKSIRNGYTRQEHNAAAAIIERLWRYAEQVEMRPDRDGDANIRTIGRFIAPVYFTEREATAYITVKETRRDGHRIYSLELEKLEAPGENPDASTPARKGQDGLSSSAAGDTSKELGTGETPVNSEDGADYTTGGEAAQGGEIRPQIRLTAKEEIERTERALKAVREGRVRVADNGESPGEANEPGMAASEELRRAQAGAAAPSDMPEVGGARPVAMSQSQMLALFRAVRACPSLPKVLQEAKRKGAAWVSRITKGSDVELNPEAFGIIDTTDRERVKGDMVAEGRFRHEDPVWNMKHSKADCEKEREISETLLEDRLRTLAEDRVRGRAPGGGRAAANALAHEIGQLVMALPVSERVRTAAGKEGAAALKDLRTIGQGRVEALEKEWGEVKGDMDDPALIGSHLAEAVETVAWWRGVTKDQAAYEQIAKEKGEEGLKAAEEEENRIKTGLSRDHKGLAGELFGMFLAAPETLRERAPRVFSRIVEAMGANDALLEAYGRIATADAPTEVMAKIEERQTVEAMKETRKITKVLQSALGTKWEQLKLAVARGIWSRESPAMMRIRWAAAEEIALAKEALKIAKKGKKNGSYERRVAEAEEALREAKRSGFRDVIRTAEEDLARVKALTPKEEIEQAKKNLELAKRRAKERVEEFQHEIIMRHRNGGAGLNYMNQLDSRVLGTLARGGLEVKDLDRYLKCKNVIANQGKAMDFGITPQEAHRALEAQRSDLGEEKWAALELAAKEFHANRERNILDDANIKEMIGEKRLSTWKLNSSYIRNERTLTAEEVAELNEAQLEPLTEKTKARFRKNKETKHWELLTDPVNVARMKPVELDIESASIGGSAERLENRTLRARLKEIFAGFGLCKNAETGSEVEFPGNSAGKMLSQSGADMSAIAPHLKTLFEGATAAWYEPEMRMEGHTFHADVKGYRNYINRFSTKDGTEWYIRFTVRENKGAAGRNDVHAATVSDVRLYKNAGATTHVNKTLRSSGEKPGATIPANNTGRSSGKMPGATILVNKTSRSSGAFVDRKISHFLSGVKTERAVDVVKEMDALIKLHQTKGVMGGDRFLKPLVGSFRPTEAPTEATAMHDMSLLEYARENHYVAALADYATKMQLKGFAVVRDMRYKGVNAGERYGTRAFMRNGENFLLIMPKDVERGFAKDPEAMQFLIELNRGMAKLLTTFSARFAVRNVARNREANENNIEWMAPSRMKEIMGAVGFRPEARAMELAIERAVVRLPDWVIRNPVARLVWTPKTNMFHIAQANRIARLLYTPGELRRVSEAADAKVREAVEKGGDVEAAAAEAKRLLAECEMARRIAKLPIFAGNYLRQLGYGGKEDVTGLMDRLEGRKGGGDGWADRLPYLGKIWKGAEWWMGKVQDFNTLEEARTKIAALLSAEWQRSEAAAKGRKWKYGDERRISDIIAVNSGSPMGELRGMWWNAMETMVSGVFGNVSMKGAVRTIESAKRSPVEWSLKAVRRAQNYAARRILWGGGGMLVLLQAARRMFGDDEEAQRSIDALESWAKKMTRAYSMISDYRLKTYDIVPLALMGNDVVLGNCLPRGDEDKILTPLVDCAVDAALATKEAKDAGFAEPLGGRYGVGDLAAATVLNSGLFPDIQRGGIAFSVIKDTFYSMFFRNPYNLFTGRPTYDEKLWEQRGERKWEFTKEMLKQAWNDLGGQSILPLAQGPEDAEDVPDGMTTVWSATGDERTVGGGKTIFHLLHHLPVGGAILSGFMFMNTKGQERVTRRLLKMEEKRRAVLDHIAMKCVDCMKENSSTGADYGKILESAREEYGIEPDEEVAIIQAVVRKLVKLARMTGNEKVPIRDLMNKEITHPSRYERIKKELIGTGWEVE